MDSKTKQLLEKIVERFEWEPMQFDLWEEAKEILSSEQEPDKAEIKLEYSTTLPDEVPIRIWVLESLGFVKWGNAFRKGYTIVAFMFVNGAPVYFIANKGLRQDIKTVGELRKHMAENEARHNNSKGTT